MRRLISVLVLFLVLAQAAHARSLELALNDDMAQFTYSTGLWNVQSAELGAGILFNEDDDLLGTLRLVSISRVSHALRFAVGMQGYLGKLDDIDTTMSAIAIGGNVGFSLASQVPLSLVLEGWLAPRILSFGKIEDVTELSARIEADLSQHAAVFVGYRKLKTDLTRGPRNYELDDSAHIGVRIRF
jgi:ethanolamine transporter EutH